MKIATYNVEFLFDEGEHKHSGKVWIYTKEYVAARVECLANIFSKIDADVLFLQEVASENVIQKIIDKTGKNYSFFIAETDKSDVGNAVIYKSKDCVCESIPAVTDFPVFVEGDVDTIGSRIHSRRAFVHLTTKYKNKDLHLFGLHLNSRFFVHLKDEKMLPIESVSQIEAADSLMRCEIFRFIQARKMRQVIDELFSKNKDAQIGVMGDFNSIVRETPFRTIQGEFTTHDDSLIPVTSRISIEKRYSFVGEYDGRKLIDYILISKNLDSSVKSFNILNENLVNHKNEPPQPSFVESDHAPLVLELS
jgi:exonuclease III